MLFFFKQQARSTHLREKMVNWGTFLIVNAYLFVRIKKWYWEQIFVMCKTIKNQRSLKFLANHIGNAYGYEWCSIVFIMVMVYVFWIFTNYAVKKNYAPRILLNSQGSYLFFSWSVIIKLLLETYVCFACPSVFLRSN